MKRLAFLLLLLAAGAAEAQTTAPAPQTGVPSPPAAARRPRRSRRALEVMYACPGGTDFAAVFSKDGDLATLTRSRPAGDRAVAPAGRLGLRLRRLLLRAARTGPRGNAHGGRPLDALPCHRPPRRAAAHLRGRRPHHHAVSRRHLPAARAPRRRRAGSRPRPMVPGGRWRRTHGVARRHGRPTRLPRGQWRPADRRERQRAVRASTPDPIDGRFQLAGLYRDSRAAACLPNA